MEVEETWGGGGDETISLPGSGCDSEAKKIRGASPVSSTDNAEEINSFQILL